MISILTLNSRYQGHRDNIVVYYNKKLANNYILRKINIPYNKAYT